jgi:uncharacterized protein YecE (DUF72 family)
MAKANIYIGTSGWHYKHWKGTFYPAEIKDAGQFSYYRRYFKTVEINNSFYMLPDARIFSAWAKAAPAGFIFSVKASRFITHMKKLKTDKNSIRIFFTHALKLGRKLGPILFQLPPGWKMNAARFAEFATNLPKGIRYAFEFREHSWYNEEIYAVLRKHNFAFCIYELANHVSPLQVTANFVYIRLHGPGDKYQGSYTDKSLKKWATLCVDWKKEKKDVFIYFDNDQEGYAAYNAQRLSSLVDKKTGK